MAALSNLHGCTIQFSIVYISCGNLKAGSGE
jgi:hypothetical protein